MSDALNKLKEIGAQKIHEDTHIPIEHIQAILYESFDGLTSIQYMGFISILERDYNLDLSDVKSNAMIYFDEKKKALPIADDGIFAVPSKTKNLTFVYIIIALFIFGAALYYTIDSADKTTNENKLVDVVLQKEIDKVKETPALFDINQTQQEQNITKIEEKKPVIPEVIVTNEPIKIMPRSKVWLGYIDVQTNKKYQKTFSDELDLDSKKEWLLIFGHGYIDVMINGEKIKFSDKNRLRLLYKDGSLKKITADEFKQINRGHTW
ncbi:hypothetical protein [Sulfurimonas sp.]